MSHYNQYDDDEEPLGEGDHYLFGDTRVQFAERSDQCWLAYTLLKEGWEMFLTEYNDDMIAFLEKSTDFRMIVTGDLADHRAFVFLNDGAEIVKFKLLWGE